MLPSAVIFDLDGTLVTSKLDFSSIRKAINCKPEEDILSFIETLEEDARTQAKAVIHEYEMEDARNCHLIPGVNEALEWLHQHNIRTGVVTRNSNAATRLKLATTQLDFDDVLTREDAPPKPDPDALLQLSTKWQLDPTDCIYIGDYIYDLLAAKNANMHAGLFTEQTDSRFEEDAHFSFTCFKNFETTIRDYWRRG